MQCAVEKFVELKKSGLCLIDMPTGTGKTTLTKDIIGRYLRGEILQDVKKIFYLTPQKKNIADIYDRLATDFQDDPELFDSNVLRIFANDECVISSLLSVEDQIQDVIKKKKSFIELRKAVFNYTQNAQIPKDVLSILAKEIKDKLEPSFRHDLAEHFRKLAKTKMERLALLNGEYSWVKEVYPSCLTNKRTVLFMTMAKFCAGNDPIIEKPYKFLAYQQTKEALVFIDEFDATKDVVLDQQVQNCADYKMDSVKLFSTICNTLKGREFPVSIFAESFDQENEYSSIRVFEKMKKRFLEVEEKYQLNYMFKLETQEKNERYFLFDDYQIHTITDTVGGKKIGLRRDDVQKLNAIFLSDKEREDGTFYKAIYAIKNAINEFIGCCGKMAQNYMEFHNRNKERITDQMELEQAISTILDPFNLDYVMEKNIAAMIVNDVSMPRHDKGYVIFDTDFYLNGFRYYDFKDDMSHDVSTKMEMSFLDSTPEKFMLSLASKARVVGLSATASIDTVLGNYCLDFLRTRLGDRFFVLPQENQDRISTYVQSRLKETNTRVTPISIAAASDLTTNDIVTQVFDSEKNREYYAGLLLNYQKGRKPNFDIGRTLKTICAIKNFIKNEKSRVLLLMTNRTIKEDGDIFSTSIIKEMIESLCTEAGIKQCPKDFYLTSSNFAEQKNAYKKALDDGYRAVIFTSYNTAGTGQNLQYEEDDREIDIDSLYLEYPRSFLIHPDNVQEDSSLIQFIFQMETLRENGDISHIQSLQNIKAAFKKIMGAKEKPRIYYEIYRCDSANNYIVKTLIQAVGRICRTENVNEETNIYVDQDIFDTVDFSSVTQGRLLNPEFQELVNASHFVIEKNQEFVMALNRASDANKRIEIKINHFLQENSAVWSEKNIQLWEELREFVLKNPTISREKLEKRIKEVPFYKDVYLFTTDNKKIKNYNYEESAGIHINNDSSVKGAYFINEEDCRLTSAIRIPAVRQYFDEQGYATTFEENDAIILPVVFQNIYKGALGEAAGKALLESYGVQLEKIPEMEKYEKFDYRLVDDPDIYIDFKNWSEQDRFDEKDYVEKCQRKLATIHGKKVIVINLFSGSFIHHNYNNVITISTLYKMFKGYSQPLDGNDKTMLFRLIKG